MRKVHVHPLPLRIWHWVNAVTVVLLIITGIQLRVPGLPSLPPNSTALLVHKCAGWVMVVSWFFWLLYGIASENLVHHYVIRRGDLKKALGQARFYLISMFRGEENPHRPSPDQRFNPLQKLAYGAVMGLFTPVMLFTGILFGDTVVFRHHILLLQAVKVLDAIHVIGAYVFALYLIIHVYMATLGRRPYSHIKAMIVGYEEESDEQGAEANIHA